MTRRRDESQDGGNRGKTVAVASDDGSEVLFWNRKNGRTTGNEGEEPASTTTTARGLSGRRVMSEGKKTAAGDSLGLRRRGRRR
ncbi:unnamed protein product [Linum tenue]|uniref:Uncharacterized protein n=1 Tax=Linum tenue TaxID=586396 RepID=A0AAV0L3S6_9ROSI|nr:unnamed protein product [Linum tenue]